jgi:hypothetical protein
VRTFELRGADVVPIADPGWERILRPGALHRRCLDINGYCPIAPSDVLIRRRLRGDKDDVAVYVLEDHELTAAELRAIESVVWPSVETPHDELATLDPRGFVP